MLKKIFFILFALAILLGPFLIFAEDKFSYPEDVLHMIRRADRSAVCEERKGIIGYLNRKEDWVVRVFTRERKSLEIWVNYGKGLFWEYYPDKVYYFTEDKGWIDSETIPGSVAKKLDRRIKFTDEEINQLKTCFSRQK